MPTANQPRRGKTAVELEQLKDLVDDLQESSTTLKTGSEKDDDTRQEVAKKFVNFYFWLLVLVLVGVPLYNSLMYVLHGNADLSISLKDTILTYSAVVGPTVGLVVAYYFKTHSDK